MPMLMRSWLFTGCSLGSRGQAGCKTERPILADLCSCSCSCLLSNAIINTIAMAVHWLFTGCSLGSKGQAGCKTERLILADLCSCSCSCLLSAAVINTIVMAVHWLFTGCSLAVHLAQEGKPDAKLSASFLPICAHAHAHACYQPL